MIEPSNHVHGVFDNTLFKNENMTKLLIFIETILYSFYVILFVENDAILFKPLKTPLIISKIFKLFLSEVANIS